MLIEDEKITFRCVTIGDSNVGKTCIVNVFLHDKFNPNEPNTIGTLYESFMEKRDEREIEVQIWDTAGQEQYRSLGPIYYRSCSSALIVYDCTNQKSFENLTEWCTEFRNVAGENTIIIVIGNKVDLINERCISKQEGEEWASKNQCLYMETSAKSGLGVKEVFNLLVDELMKVYGGDDGMKIINKSKLNDLNKKNEDKKTGCC